MKIIVALIVAVAIVLRTNQHFQRHHEVLGWYYFAFLFLLGCGKIILGLHHLHFHLLVFPDFTYHSPLHHHLPVRTPH